MDKKKLLKRIGRIAGNVLLCVFIIICVIGLVLVITAKKDPDGTMTVFGTQMRIVQTSSMEASEHTDVSGYEIQDIPVGSMIFIEVVPEDAAEADAWYKALKIGDVLTFKYVYANQVTITHRITAIEPNENGGYTITLEGDNKGSDSGTMVQTLDTTKSNTPNYVIGKVTGQSYLVGTFVRALKSPVGLICIVIVPSLLIVILEVFKIINALTADKKKAAAEARAEQQNELDALKRRLAELEAGNAATQKDGAEDNTDTDDNNVTNGQKP